MTAGPDVASLPAQSGSASPGPTSPGTASPGTASREPAAQAGPASLLAGIVLGSPGSRAAAKQYGYGRVVHSDNIHDNAVIPVPVVVISSGDGPTVLLVAGTHGDEYEGQVLLHELARRIVPEHLSGTVILVPSANVPAVRGGTRVSPVDAGNLNRTYPGDANGGPTAQIAHLIAAELLPLADVVVDLHSGGSNSTYLPCSFIYRGPDASLWARKVAAAKTIGLPYTMVVAPRLEPGSLSTAGDDAGLLSLSTELGGGGTVDPDILDMARGGLLGLLENLGVLRAGVLQPQNARGAAWIGDGTGVPRTSVPQDRHRTRWLELGSDSPVTSTVGGLFEPLITLGQRVRAGEPVGRVHFLDELDRDPKEFYAPFDGVAAIIRRPTLVVAGAHLLHVAAELDEP